MVGVDLDVICIHVFQCFHVLVDAEQLLSYQWLHFELNSISSSVLSYYIFKCVLNVICHFNKFWNFLNVSSSYTLVWLKVS